MTGLIHKLRQLARLGLRTRTEARPRASYATLPPMGNVMDDEVVRKLMQMIGNTHETEYNCEETAALLDEYVELVARNREAAALLPLVKRHLDLCIDCQETYEALMRVLEGVDAPGER